MGGWHKGAGFLPQDDIRKSSAGQDPNKSEGSRPFFLQPTRQPSFAGQNASSLLAS